MTPDEMINASDNNEDWTLTVTTHSRDQLIDISRVIANSFHTSFFHDPDNIPYILIPGSGWGGSGKSLIIEAMMKTLLDEYDPEEMKRQGPRNQMFLENGPGGAHIQYCCATGHTNAAPVMYAFDRITNKYSFKAQSNLIEAFRKAASAEGVLPTGAIFSSGTLAGNTKPWLTIDLMAGIKWDRYLTITVLNEALTTSAQFRHYWKHLQNFAQTGTLPQSALIAPVNPGYIIHSDLACNLNDLPEMTPTK